MFDALVDREDGEVAGAVEPAGVEHPGKVVEDADVAVAGDEDSVDEVGAGKVERFLGDGLAGVAEQGLGLCARCCRSSLDMGLTAFRAGRKSGTWVGLMEFGLSTSVGLRTQ